MQISKPRQRRVGEVREDRDRPDEIKRSGLQTKRGLGLTVHSSERRAEILLEPVDAPSIDVGTPHLRGLGFRKEMPQRPTGSAAEVQDPLTVKGPVVREQIDESGLRSGTQHLISREWVVGSFQAQDPVHEIQGRIRTVGTRGHFGLSGPAAGGSGPARPSAR